MVVVRLGWHDNIDARIEQLYDVGGHEILSSPQESVRRMPPFKSMYVLLLIRIVQTEHRTCRCGPQRLAPISRDKLHPAHLRTMSEHIPCSQNLPPLLTFFACRCLWGRGIRLQLEFHCEQHHGDRDADNKCRSDIICHRWRDIGRKRTPVRDKRSGCAFRFGCGLRADGPWEEHRGSPDLPRQRAGGRVLGIMDISIQKLSPTAPEDSERTDRRSIYLHSFYVTVYARYLGARGHNMSQSMYSNL